MDRILVSDLHLRCIIGVNDEERRERQDVMINLVISADLSKACKSDRLEDTVDYHAVKERIVKMVEASRYCLVEGLAEAIAGICLDDNRMHKVRVRVEKPMALRFARSVGVEITRERKG